MTSPPASEERFAWQIAVLATVSAFSPAMTRVNSTERASWLGFVAVALVFFAASLGARWLMNRLTGNALGSTYAVAAFMLCFTNLGLWLDRSLGRGLLILFAILVSAILYRLASVNIVRLAVSWGAVALIAYPLVLGITAAGTSASTLPETEPLAAEFVASQRDVVIIVLDGYANGSVLLDLYRHDNSRFESSLIESGFQVAPRVIANYGRTRFSVSSVMQLDYPVREGGLSGEDLNLLLEFVGGRNALSSWLAEAGYGHVYIESGWFGTKCEATVDICVRSPIPDESYYDVIYRSLLQGLPGFETGRAFSRGARHALAWLDSDLVGWLTNGRPELIYVHALAPHPPLLLNRECELNADGGVSGFTIAQPGMTRSDLEHARRRYVDQVVCVNTVLERVSRLADREDAIVLMFGDHGPDSLGQLFVSGAEWSEEQRRERLSPFFASRVPSCDMGDLPSLVNAGRRLVSCLSDQEYPDLQTFAYDFAFVGSGQTITEIRPPEFDS